MQEAKVTLLIDTKFKDLPKLKETGQKIQQALGPANLLKEYAKLERTLARIIKQIGIIADGGRGGGRGGAPLITSSHGGGGGAAAASPTQSNVLYGPRGQVISTLGAAARGGGGGGRRGGSIGAGMRTGSYYGSDGFDWDHALREEHAQWSRRIHSAQADIKFRAENQAQRALDKVDVTWGMGSYRPSFGRRSQRPVPIVDPDYGTIVPRPQTRPHPDIARLRNLGVGVGDAALAAQAAQIANKARLAQLHRSNMEAAGRLGGGLALLAGAAGAGGAMLTGPMGGMGGAGATMGAFGTVGGGLLGAGIGSLFGLPGAMAGAIGGSMLGGSVGGTFGGIGGAVAQYGTKGLQLQEAAAGLAAMGLGSGTQGAPGAATRGVSEMFLGRLSTVTPARRVKTVEGSSGAFMSRGGGVSSAAKKPTYRIIPAVRARTGGMSSSLGYSADQIQTMAGQAWGAAMVAPESVYAQSPKGRAEVTAIQQLQRGLGVDAGTTGQMLFGLRRSSGADLASDLGNIPGTGLKGFGQTMLTPGLSYPEQRGMFQLSGRMLGTEFARTGISGRETMANIRGFVKPLAAGGSGFRAQQFAEGAVNYGRNLARGGPKSPYDFALISIMAGGGGVSPEKLLSVYKGLETGDILKPGTATRRRFNDYLGAIRGSAGGDKALATMALHQALQPMLPGLGLSSTEEAMGMITGGKAWSAIKGKYGKITADSTLENLADANATKQIKHAAKIRNDILALGTEMIDTMEVFKEAANQMATGLKEAAPIMAEIHQWLAGAMGGYSPGGTK